jgi:hypothetical protein
MFKKIFINNKKVVFSYKDKEFKIKVPKKMTKQLSYFIGFHIGDGSMGFYGRGDYAFQYGGNYKNEILYYDKFIAPLVKKLFNKTVKPKYLPCNMYGFKFKSKAIYTFMLNSIKLPTGPKDTIIIPKIILDNKKQIKIACLRGIFDTDFGICFKGKNKSYPEISCWLKSTPLINDIKTILDELGFSYKSRKYDFKRHGKKFPCNQIVIRGRDQFDKWFKLIGSHSLKNTSKYQIFKKVGCCKLSRMKDRLKLLRRGGSIS